MRFAYLVCVIPSAAFLIAAMELPKGSRAAPPAVAGGVAYTGDVPGGISYAFQSAPGCGLSARAA